MGMLTICKNCRQHGHYARQCTAAPSSARPLQRTPPPTWEPPLPPQNRHAYPDDHWLLYACPHCGRPAMTQCWNVGTGKDRRPHDSRLQLAG